MNDSAQQDPIQIVVSISYGRGLNISHRVPGTLSALRKAGSDASMLMVSLLPDPSFASMLVEAGDLCARDGNSAGIVFDLLIPIGGASGT